MIATLSRVVRRERPFILRNHRGVPNGAPCPTETLELFTMFGTRSWVCHCPPNALQRRRGAGNAWAVRAGVTRDELIRRFRDHGWTITDIGVLFDLTRERIRQIVSAR